MSNVWTRSILLAVLAIGASAAPAFAQSPPKPAGHPHGINAREARQAERIKNGKEAGKLTKGELDRLRANEAALRARERVFRESGQGLNSEEYKALERELDRLSKEIYRATHNGREPGGGK
jgi:hypothetical protein